MRTTSVRKNRWKLIHQYYKYTGFYRFVGQSVQKALLPIVAVVAALVIFDKYVLDISELMTQLTERYNSLSVLAVFFISESFLGLLPPEIFIAWAEKTGRPIEYLTILATLSYAGGVIAYGYGQLISHIPSVRNYLEQKLSKHQKNIRKWGGFLIVVGALLPLPFAIVSLTSGMIGYRFKYYLLFGLLRFPRFYLYALAIFHMV